jgi:hypothetical protein
MSSEIEPETGEHGAQAYRLFSRHNPSALFFGRCGKGMDAQRADGGDDGHGYGDSIYRVGAVKEGVGDSSDGGAGDGCDLKGAGIPGDRVGEMFFGNQLRQQGAAHRKAETAADSDEYEDDVDQVD